MMSLSAIGIRVEMAVYLAQLSLAAVLHSQKLLELWRVLDASVKAANETTATAAKAATNPDNKTRAGSDTFVPQDRSHSESMSTWQEFKEHPTAFEASLEIATLLSLFGFPIAVLVLGADGNVNEHGWLSIIAAVGLLLLNFTRNRGIRPILQLFRSLERVMATADMSPQEHVRLKRLVWGSRAGINTHMGVAIVLSIVLCFVGWFDQATNDALLAIFVALQSINYLLGGVFSLILMRYILRTLELHASVMQRYTVTGATPAGAVVIAIAPPSTHAAKLSAVAPMPLPDPASVAVASSPPAAGGVVVVVSPVFVAQTKLAAASTVPDAHMRDKSSTVGSSTGSGSGGEQQGSEAQGGRHKSPSSGPNSAQQLYETARDSMQGLSAAIVLGGVFTLAGIVAVSVPFMRHRWSYALPWGMFLLVNGSLASATQLPTHPVRRAPK